MNIDAYWPWTKTVRVWPALRRWYRLFLPWAPVCSEELSPISGLITPRQARRMLLFAIDSLTGGRAERVICQVANDLDMSRYEIQRALTLISADVQDVNDRVTVVDLKVQIPESLLVCQIPAQILGVTDASKPSLRKRLRARRALV